MKKIYFFTVCLVMVWLNTIAQLPCSDFNDPVNPAGNWAPGAPPNGNVGVSWGSPNALDGSQYLILSDQSGGSWYVNNVDFNNLGEYFPGHCLCFDFYLENDGGFGSPLNPFIALSNGTNHITFTANVTVTENSGWVRVCAPILLCDGNGLPSNAQGSWTMPPSMGCDEFNEIMAANTSVILSPDIISSPSEIVYFDNICVQERCTDCSADFELQTSFSTLTDSATANLTLTFPNPNSAYMVDWGDGSPSQIFGGASISYVYGSPGYYNVCVTEVIESGEEVCRRCFNFCYVKREMAASPARIGTEVSSPFYRYESIANKELRNETDNIILVPNPAKNFVDIQMSIPKNESVFIRVIDIYGKIVSEQYKEVQAGSQRITVSTESLSAGMYIVEIRSAAISTSKKLLIAE